MIEIYCKKKHHTHNSLCPDCSNLRLYAYQRLDRCHFGENKPLCQSCPIHCYHPDMRARIQGVMKFSGPRMIFYAPMLTFRHLLGILKPRKALISREKRKQDL
ncbi:nitrous oxide-stimulated promoter family protein [Dysgonomonas macrotermitis]